MSCLWGLSLLYAASFLQSRAMADDGVWLECNTSVTVQARNTVTLYCTIHSRDGNFVGDRYSWAEGARNNTICSNTWKKERCEWDNRTYVWLTIQDVVKESEYTVTIKGPSGRANLSIKVQVNEKTDPTVSTTRSSGPNETFTKGPVIANSMASSGEMAIHEKVILFTFIAMIALGLLYFLFGTDRGRKMTAAIRKDDGSYQEGKGSRELL